MTRLPLALSLVLSACSASPEPPPTSSAGGKADEFGLDHCFAAATAAVLALEAENGSARMIQSAEHLHGFEHRAVWQFLLAESATSVVADTAMVSTESVPGGCRVSGLALASEYLPMHDDGFERIEGAEPSDSCIEPIEALLDTVADAAGESLETWRWELIDGHSDHELIRVFTHTPDWEWSPAFTVHAETLGGDPCRVYSLVNTDEQLYLSNENARGDDAAADLSMVRDLQNMIIELAGEYERTGVDNNWITYETVLGVGEPGFEHPSRPADGDEVEDYTNAGFSVLKSVAAECAFMIDGSYGDHLTRSQQNKLAGKFVAAYYAIGDLWGVPTTFERITHYRADRFGYWVSPCSLRVTVPSVGIDLILDSASVD